MLLAGDVGGTKTALALFDDTRPGCPRVRGAVVPSRDFSGLDAAVRSFLEGARPSRIDAACFGVAVVVVDGRVETTNLPWTLDERRLAADIGAARLRLINDLEAAGHGVLGLSPDELATLQPGTPRPGNKVLIAAGTGLGEALLVWDGRGHHVVASEGGHADFAPRSAQQARLLAALGAGGEHVSYERVVSGPGLRAVYRFLRDEGGAPEPAWLSERMAAGDASAAIAEAALAGDDPVCVQALDLFVSVYGAEAGNLALKALAVGGVFVGGGIAPRLRARLAAGDFLEAFRAKGRFRDLLTSIPVHLVLNPDAALLGAAGVARALLAGAGPATAAGPC